MAGSKFLLTMKFMTQGKIVSSGTRRQGNLGNSEGIECHSFNYEVIPQIDRDTGQPVGKRQHPPITIRKMADSTSPKLMHAMWTQEVFETATLSFDRFDYHGKPCPVRTIILKNGVIAAIRPGAPLGRSSQPDWASGQPTESVTFVYGELLVDGLLDRIIPYWIMG